MKKDILGILTVVDFVFGLTFILVGIIYTFSQPYVGWGLIVSGIWMMTHFYFLVWGLEEVLKEEKNR